MKIHDRRPSTTVDERRIVCAAHFGRGEAVRNVVVDDRRAGSPDALGHRTGPWVARLSSGMFVVTRR